MQGVAAAMWHGATQDGVFGTHKQHDVPVFGSQLTCAGPELFQDRQPHVPVAVQSGLNPRPYTLHFTPYTLHPAPYILHPTPYTLH